jgi:hypothetical protein
MMPLEEEVKVLSRMEILEPLSDEDLSLCFNHEKFCDELQGYRKTFREALLSTSAALFERRIALGSTRKATLGPPRRAPAGFRRLCGRAQLRQKCQNPTTNLHRRQSTRSVASLPRKPQVRDTRSCQAQLRVDDQHQPTPAVGLLGMAHSWGGPPQTLFEKAEGMLQIEAPHVRPPEQVQLRLSRTVPPQPQLLGLSTPLAAWQAAYLHQHKRAPNDGARAAGSACGMILDFGVQPRPSAHAHHPISHIFAAMFCGGCRPSVRLLCVQLRTVAGLTSCPSRWERIGVEAAPGPQPHEDLRPASLKALLQPHRVVASVEDEQWHASTTTTTTTTTTTSFAQAPE